MIACTTRTAVCQLLIQEDTWTALRVRCINTPCVLLFLLRMQEEGHQPLVDALLQGTTALAIGHAPDGAEFAGHLASFEAVARGLAFHAVEEDGSAETAQRRRELFSASCATLAALSKEVGTMRAEAAEGAEDAEVAQAADREEL